MFFVNIFIKGKKEHFANILQNQAGKLKAYPKNQYPESAHTVIYCFFVKIHPYHNFFAQYESYI